MALILNIDTATEIASISISEKDMIIHSATNTNQKDHASFLQPAIKDLLKKSHLPINKLNAVAITAGPGSYTGLRVGMASAKGLCYALNIPMITLNTLEVMALSTFKQTEDKSALYCPMIDAKRMEVFTAVYDYQLIQIIEPCAMVLSDKSFNDTLQTNKIYFSGSGIKKFKEIKDNKRAVFLDTKIGSDAMAQLSYKSYLKKHFADIYTSSPDYLKEFYTASKLE
jgi:tRNA threonylcarbamoyladenosine biosynthesis protein TsaB